MVFFLEEFQKFFSLKPNFFKDLFWYLDSVIPDSIKVHLNFVATKVWAFIPSIVKSHKSLVDFREWVDYFYLTSKPLEITTTESNFLYFCEILNLSTFGLSIILFIFSLGKINQYFVLDKKGEPLYFLYFEGKFLFFYSFKIQISNKFWGNFLWSFYAWISFAIVEGKSF